MWEMKRLSVALRLCTQKADRNKLPFGIPANLRAAQISGVSFVDRVVTFQPDEWPCLESFQPRVRIGHAGALKQVSERFRKGSLNLASVNHAIFVLTNRGELPLSDTLRVFLWQSFGVPLYEVVIAEDGNLLAVDCEADEGWHLQPGVRARLIDRELYFEVAGARPLSSGLEAAISSELCACGRSTVRISGMMPLPQHPANQLLAATA
jgi:hypothetical protein